MRALRGCRLVVVPVDPDGPPTSFSVRMPARALVRTPPGRYASVARVRVGLLTASTHVDRVIEVVIPDGVRCVADGTDAAAGKSSDDYGFLSDIAGLEDAGDKSKPTPKRSSRRSSDDLLAGLADLEDAGSMTGHQAATARFSPPPGAPLS